MNAPISNKGMRKYVRNDIKDWNSLQGYLTHDAPVIQPVRNIDFSQITVMNGTRNTVGINISKYQEIPSSALFTLKPGESKVLAINENMINTPPSQQLHIFTAKGRVGVPSLILSRSNGYVVRYNEMMKGYYIQPYYFPTSRSS
jgi:hypothetical protein